MIDNLAQVITEHHPCVFPSAKCTCGVDLADGPYATLPFHEAHARHVAAEIHAAQQVPCGGCQGLGAHSPRCNAQPGWLWRRLYNRADSLGDCIGANDPELANLAYTLASRLKRKWELERADIQEEP